MNRCWHDEKLIRSTKRNKMKSTKNAINTILNVIWCCSPSIHEKKHTHTHTRPDRWNNLTFNRLNFTTGKFRTRNLVWWREFYSTLFNYSIEYVQCSCTYTEKRSSFEFSTSNILWPKNLVWPPYTHKLERTHTHTHDFNVVGTDNKTLELLLNQARWNKTVTRPTIHAKSHCKQLTRCMNRRKREQRAEKATENIMKTSYMYYMVFKFILFLSLSLFIFSLTLPRSLSLFHLVLFTLVFGWIAMYRLENAHVNCVTMKFTIIFL